MSALQRNVPSGAERGETAVFAGYEPFKRPLVATPRMAAVNGDSSLLVQPKIRFYGNITFNTLVLIAHT